MSDYERHRGTIERVYFDGSIEEFAESLNLGKLDKFYDDWEEYFIDELSDEYIIYGGNIFKISNIFLKILRANAVILKLGSKLIKF